MTLSKPKEESPTSTDRNAPLVFKHEPLVLGVLNGELDRDIVAKYPLKLIHHRAGMCLLSSGHLETWQGGSAGGWYWTPLQDQTGPVAWTDVMRYAMAPGIAYDDKGWRLHNDCLSVHDLYYGVQGSSVYFSNWPALLIELLDQVGMDSQSWVSLLTLGFVPPGRSPWSSIHTLPPFASLKVEPSTQQLEWMETAFDLERGSDRSLLETLVEGLSIGPIYTLSGGWDSRLLTGLAAKWWGRSQVETWTTSSTGAPQDHQLASRVAEYLQTNHHEHLPTNDELTEAVPRAASRLNGSTWMHSWLEPLAWTLRQRGRPVVDGLAGDVLLKGLFQDLNEDQTGHKRPSRRRLWKRLGGWSVDRDDIWSEKALSLFRDVGFRGFDESIIAYKETLTWQTMAVLTTRTARGVSRYPQRLLGPELKVLYPFLNPDVLATALHPSMHSRRGHELYRQILRSLDANLERLPSTNDELVQGMRVGNSGAAQSQLRFMRDVIRKNGQFADLLAPKLVDTVSRGDQESLARLSRWSAPMRAIYGLCTYSLWLRDDLGLHAQLVD